MLMPGAGLPAGGVGGGGGGGGGGRRLPCAFYNSRNGCKNGSSCNYVHDPNYKPPPQEFTRITSISVGLQTGGGQAGAAAALARAGLPSYGFAPVAGGLAAPANGLGYPQQVHAAPQVGAAPSRWGAVGAGPVPPPSQPQPPQQPPVSRWGGQ
jgi:hypothetical protein